MAVYCIKEKANLCVIGISEGKRRESEEEMFEEIMADNSKETKILYHTSKKLRQCETG